MVKKLFTIICIFSISQYVIGQPACLDKERLAVLEKAVQSENGEVSHRAFYELGQYIAENDFAQNIYIKAMFSKNVFFGYEEVEVLSRADEKVAQKVLDEVKKGKDIEVSLVLLGRMGPKAKNMIPYLVEQLPKYSSDPAMEGRIRAVLANVGYNSKENHDLILSDLKERTLRGKGIIEQLSRSGVGAWVTDAMIAEMIKWWEESNIYIDKAGDFVLDITMAIAPLGQRAKNVKEPLEKAIKAIEPQKEYSTVYLTYNIALLKIEPEKSQSCLRKILFCISSEVGGRSDWLIFMWSKYLFDSKTIESIAKYLHDADNNIVASAVNALGMIGADAKRYKTEVLAVLKTNPSLEVRKNVAMVLRRLADPADIPALQDAIKVEQRKLELNAAYETVSDEIEETIRIINLQDEYESMGEEKGNKTDDMEKKSAEYIKSSENN